MSGSYTICRNCDATLWVNIGVEKLPNIDAAMALEDAVANKIAELASYACDVDVHLDEFSPLNDGTVDEDSYASYIVEYSYIEDITVYRGAAGGYWEPPEPDTFEAEDDIATEMLNEVERAFKDLGHKVLDGDIEDDRSDTLEDLKESVVERD